MSLAIRIFRCRDRHHDEWSLVACRREFVTALEHENLFSHGTRHKDCLSGALALLTFSLRQATRSFTIRLSTPWGAAQTIKTLAPGILLVGSRYYLLCLEATFVDRHHLGSKASAPASLQSRRTTATQEVRFRGLDTSLCHNSLDVLGHRRKRVQINLYLTAAAASIAPCLRTICSSFRNF